MRAEDLIKLVGYHVDEAVENAKRFVKHKKITVVEFCESITCQARYNEIVIFLNKDRYVTSAYITYN